MLLTGWLLLLSGCLENPNIPIKLAINQWPGYAYLYLAEQQGLFAEHDLNLELVPFGSLSDAQRAYVSGRVDGIASTLIEAVQAQALSSRPLNIVLLTDYSNGADVVLARPSISTVADLKGKTIGAEVTSLGIYMLHRTLATAQLSLDDVTVKNLEPGKAFKAFSVDYIDAYVTYPPHSIDLMHSEDLAPLFTSADIPFDILDSIAFSVATLDKHPELPAKLRRIWQQALDYDAAHPEQAQQSMAKMLGISVAELQGSLANIHVLSAGEQQTLFRSPDTLQAKARDVCAVLHSIDALVYDCQQLPDIIYRAPW